MLGSSREEAGSRGEKITRLPARVLKGGGCLTVRKAIRAGALFGGKQPGCGSLNPLGFRGGRVVSSVHRKSERGDLKRDASGRVSVEGEPERPERPGEQRSPALV
jgi:hypothetical protein